MFPSADARCRSLGLAPALAPQLCQKSCLWGCVGNWIRKLTHKINKHFLLFPLCQVIYNLDGFSEQFTTWPCKMTFLEELEWTAKQCRWKNQLVVVTEEQELHNLALLLKPADLPTMGRRGAVLIRLERFCWSGKPFTSVFRNNCIYRSEKQLSSFCFATGERLTIFQHVLQHLLNPTHPSGKRCFPFPTQQS